MHRAMAVAVVILVTGCATGPRRQTVKEFFSGEATAPECWYEAQDCRMESGVQTCGAFIPHGACIAINLRPMAEPPPEASPFSAGLMLGAGIQVETGAVIPAQLALGSLKVTEVAGRGVSLLALGGISQTDVSEARLSWGFGAGLQLTPEPLAYEVDMGLGLLWVKDESAPAAVLGFALTPKM